jgi:membrane protease YdiL (CAAX protease family)
VNDSGTSVGKKVWGPWATVGFGLALVVTQLLVVGVIAAVQHNTDSQFYTSAFLENLAKDGSSLGISVCASAIAGIAFVLLIIKLRKGASIAEYLALIPISWKTIVGAIALVAGFIVVWDGITIMLGKPIVTQFMVDAYQKETWPVVYWVALVIAAPAVEEISFRGFLLEGFRRSRLGDFGAISLTALAWALLHIQYGIYEMAIIFALGVLFGIVRIKTGSLWSACAMHASCNLVAMIETAWYVKNLVG